jgi:hypothetical protein
MASIFEDFIGAFKETYNFAPLWLTTDHIRWGEGHRRRLLVLLDREADALEFRVRGEQHGNFDSEQQRVARLFVENVPAAEFQRLFGLDEPQTKKPLASQLFVAFSDFERDARFEVHTLVTKEEIHRFEKGLGLGKLLWCTYRDWGAPIVFAQTEAQASELREQGRHINWGDAYFSIAKGHDKFGYLRREDCHVGIDSKERFDSVFQSNWFYYWKR